MDLQYFVELFCGGLTRGSIYALIALGYTMVYGIIELINFAHGEIYMIGAFTALIVASALGIMGFAAGIIVIAALAAVIWCAAYGYTIEKIAYRPLRGAPRLSPLISAIGVSIFLQNYVSLAQTSDFVAFPQLITDFEFLDPISHIIGTSDFLNIVTSLVTMVALTLFIQYTKMGKAMRATAQNRKMAMLLGIDADRIISLTFIIGSSLAAIGGVLVAHDGLDAGPEGVRRGSSRRHRLNSRRHGRRPCARPVRKLRHRLYLQRLRRRPRLRPAGAHPHLPSGGHPRKAQGSKGLRGPT